jgi:hypothetical protein
MPAVFVSRGDIVQPDVSELFVRRQRALRDLYADFNAQFWDGRLPHAQRVLTFGGDPFKRGISVRRVGIDPTRGTTRGLRCKGAHGFVSGIFRAPTGAWPAEIRVLSPLGVTYGRITLLHEMAHAAVWFARGSDERHGPSFVAELERLAALGETWATEQAERYRRASG